MVLVVALVVKLALNVPHTVLHAIVTLSAHNAQMVMLCLIAIRRVIHVPLATMPKTQSASLAPPDVLTVLPTQTVKRVVAMLQPLSVVSLVVLPQLLPSLSLLSKRRLFWA